MRKIAFVLLGFPGLGLTSLGIKAVTDALFDPPAFHIAKFFVGLAFIAIGFSFFALCVWEGVK